jgi:hypothetical protein
MSELTGGLAMEATLPANLRWIPIEMTVRYRKKARGKLVGECHVDATSLASGDVNVPLEIKDAAGDTVLSGEILFRLSHRKSAD